MSPLLVLAQSIRRLVVTSLANFADTAMGIVHINGDLTSSAASLNIDTSYTSICLSLNVILTLMIVARLILHSRNIRRATGTSDGTAGLYTTIVTMLVESYALYAASLVFYIVPWALESWVVSIPAKILGPIQVRVVTAHSDISKIRNVVAYSSRPTGHRSLPDHPTSRQAESIDGQNDHLWAR